MTNLASTLNYDVKKTDGEIKGVFTDQVGHAKVYVEEYDGEMSTVTVKFADETNNTEIEDSFLVKNRKGEQYYTPDLPSIKITSLFLTTSRQTVQASLILQARPLHTNIPV